MYRSYFTLYSMKSIKTPNHPAYHWSILWPLEVWVRGLYNSWWFCVHKLSLFIYLSMIYCSVKYCSNSSIHGVNLHSIMKSIKTPNHPAYHWSTLWPLEVWVRGLYNCRWFCVHKLSLFIYLSMNKTDELMFSSRKYL